MCKYTKAITLESIDGFKPVKFIVVDAESKEACDNELMEWIKQYPKLLENENNQKILEYVINKKVLKRG